MSTKLKGSICGLIAGTSWGITGCCAQYLFSGDSGINSPYLTAVRLLCGGALLLVVCLLKYKKEFIETLKNKHDMIHILLYGIAGIMLCQYSFFCAVTCSNATTATVIQYTGPVIVVTVVCLIEKRLPSKIELTALILAVTGTFLIATHGNIHSLVVSPTGLFWALISGLALAGYALLLGDTAARRPSMVSNAIGMTSGGICMVLIARLWKYELSLSFKDILLLAVAVIIGTLLAYTCFIKAVNCVGPINASLISSIEPVASAVISATVLHTKFATIDLIGFAFIIATVFVLAKK